MAGLEEWLPPPGNWRYKNRLIVRRIPFFFMPRPSACLGQASRCGGGYSIGKERAAQSAGQKWACGGGGLAGRNRVSNGEFPQRAGCHDAFDGSACGEHADK